MAEIGAITYELLVCKLGKEELEKNSIRELRIERSINDHVRLMLTGIVAGDLRERYLDETTVKTPVTVEVVKAGGNTVLFTGVVTNITVKMDRDVYCFEVEGASYTYNLDIKRIDHSFQDGNMTYRDCIETVLANEPANCNKAALKEEKLGSFLLQYHETGWDFLRRLAARKPFNTGLVADASAEKAQFWFGIPEGVERIVKEPGLRFSMHKRLACYRDTAANHQTGAGEPDFIEYELVTDDFYNIGDRVSFKGQKLRVSRSVATIKGGIIEFKCHLTTEAGLKQPLLHNQRLSGVSIEGKVIAVEKDMLKLSLIGIGEKNQNPESACWFPYASAYTAEGNTGWYCMPEENDFVRLYFGTYQEEDAFVTTSVRLREKDENGKPLPPKSSGDKITEPKVKYFRTKFGKEIMFSEKEILITGKDGELLVRLNEEKGIEILSPQAVSVTAKKDVTINSEEGRVAISAGTELELICNGSNIKMDGETHLKGAQVKIN